MNRPDQSSYLAHFTKDSKQKLDDISKNAQDILIEILQSKKLKSNTEGWTKKKVVCFTECPWGSLLEHSRNYSPYGIGFSKALIFSRNGAPVFYVRADQFKKQQWDKHLLPFVTPFWPKYRPKSKLASIKKTIDYSHEREWRIPHDFEFEYEQIEFVILNSYEDMAKFPQILKDAIGREKFILMENYVAIEKLWPVHIL